MAQNLQCAEFDFQSEIIKKDKVKKMASTSKKTVKKAHRVTVDDTVVSGVMFIMSSNKEWTGTMTDLGKLLHKANRRVKNRPLPGSPSALRVVLNRVANRLRCRGVSVKFNRAKDSTRTRYVRFATR